LQGQDIGQLTDLLARAEEARDRNDYCMADPDIRRRSWQMRREIIARQAEPNAAHRAISEPIGTALPRPLASFADVQ
jgi:hypothetical protein